MAGIEGAGTGVPLGKKKSRVGKVAKQNKNKKQHERKKARRLAAKAEKEYTAGLRNPILRDESPG